MRLLAGIILTLFLGLLFGSLWQLAGPMEMNMVMHHTGDCPAMTDGATLCPMSLADHLSAWKATFAEVVPTAWTLLLLAGGAVLLATLAPHLAALRRWRLPVPRFAYLLWRTYTYTLRPYQTLFSDGILHPKLF